MSCIGDITFYEVIPKANSGIWGVTQNQTALHAGLARFREKLVLDRAVGITHYLPGKLY